MKTCSKCGIEKGSEQYSKCSKHADGLSYTCKQCDTEYNSQYRKQNKEKLFKIRREYEENNRKIINESQLKRLHANKDKIKKISLLKNEQYLNGDVFYSKLCHKCKIKKSSSDFNKSSSTRDGLKCHCRSCQKIEGIKYRADNFDKIKYKGILYRTINKERERLRIIEYKINNVEKEKARHKKYYEANKAKCYSASEKCRKNNPEPSRKSSLKSYYKYHEYKKDKNREWKRNNKERAKETIKLWKNNNKERIRKYNIDNIVSIKALGARRRAGIKTASVAWANQDKIKEIYAEAIRLSKVTGISFHVDHIIPLHHKKICGLHCEYNLQILTFYDNCSKSNKFTPT